jgi:uncharacterized repeat protein (TIGR01451 family)
MATPGITRRICMALSGLCAMALGSGQATSPAIEVRAIAEVEIKVGGAGREFARLVPANRVVPGDEVIYTLEIRNAGPHDVAAPTVIEPIPTYMAYLADTATGPGAEVTYSVDGGRTFDVPESLEVLGADGRPRVAKSIEYTHIRWQLRNILKSRSVAFARFRAVVK